MNILTLVTRNTTRHPLRTFLTVLGLAIAVMAFVIIRTSVESWYAGASASSPNRLIMINAVSLISPLPLAYKDKISKVEGVTGLSWAQWFGGIYVDPKNFFPQFMVEPESYLELYPEFQIPPDQKKEFLSQRNSVLVGRKLIDRFGWSIGDQIRLSGTIYPGDWDFVIRAIYTGREEITDETQMLMHWQYLDERMRQESPGRSGKVGSFVIEIDDPTQAAAKSKEIDALFKNSLAETRTETEEAFQLSFVAMTGSILTGLKIISILVIGVILLVLGNTMAMTARERVSEYAVLKTLGFGKTYLVSLIFGESMVIAVMGGLTGLALSIPVKLLMAPIITAFFPVFKLGLFTMIMAVVVALIVGILAAIFPSLKAVRTPIVDGLRTIE